MRETSSRSSTSAGAAVLPNGVGGTSLRASSLSGAWARFAELGLMAI